MQSAERRVVSVKCRAYLNCRHPCIHPPLHQSSLHKPGQLSLGQDRVDEAEAAVVPDVHPREARPHRLLCCENPVELVLPVLVLAGSECVCDALQRVHKWAGTVVGWVHLQSVRRGDRGVTGGGGGGYTYRVTGG